MRPGVLVQSFVVQSFAPPDTGSEGRTAWRKPAISRRDAPEALPKLSPNEGAGKTGCALHPRSRVQCAQGSAHTSIQVQRRASGLPCAMVLRLMPRSPRRRIPLASVIGELAVDRSPVGLKQPPPTPATGARTTRFCRTQLPSPNHSTSHVRPAEVLAEAFKRRSSTRCRSLTDNRPANMPARPTLPRPPHPIPTFRDDRDTPLVQGDEVRELWG
jgi:hypothetical protein